MTDISPEAVERLAMTLQKRGYVSPPRNPEDYTARLSCKEALDVAATLRAQAARIAELEAALDSHHAVHGSDIWRFWSDKALTLAARIAELEAQLASARNDARRDAWRNRLGKWMSAALDDPAVCDEMKADIQAMFAADDTCPRCGGTAYVCYECIPRPVTNDQVECVAKAIYNANKPYDVTGNFTWNTAPDFVRELTKNMARAAIAEMQPTPQEAAKTVVEAAQWARNRLERIADDAWHGDGRDLKRSLIGVFADFDRALAEAGSTMPDHIRRATAGED